MSEKHLKTGDALPALEPDHLRLYSMRFCPFAQRTRLVLEHKGLQYETVNINLSRKPDWMFEKNPLGKVPFIELNGQVVYESTITCELLEELYPEKPLLPRDPFQRAGVRMLTEHFGQIIPGFYKMRTNDEEVKNQVFQEMRKSLERFEKALDKTYFGGDSVGMLDYYAWPWWERIAAPEQIIPRDSFPNLHSWLTTMSQDPAVIATAETVPTHAAFIAAYTRGEEPDYDIEPIAV